MKLACQERLVPGATLEERLENLERAGYEGIEIGGRCQWEREDEIRRALRSSKVKVSTLCSGYRGMILDADSAARQQAADDIRRLLDLAAEVGAVGLIFVPVFGPPRFPDLSPWKTAPELEKSYLVDVLGPWAEYAEKAGTLLLLEALNRYETHLLRRIADIVRVAEQVNRPKGLRVMADFFHMSIEERDTAAAIEGAGDWIAHVHLADSTRELPGYGHTDFQAGFAALREVGFDRYMALECNMPGDGDALEELEKTAQFLRAQMATE